VIGADRFCDELADRGIDFVAGVPCSFFSAPIERLTREGRYVPAANEGSALALAAGAAVGGARAVVIAQNSGLGNLINPLTSLGMTYDIPVLMFVSLRGWPDPAGDEPQHAVMGVTTHGLLDALGVPNWTLAAAATSLVPVLDEAERELAAGRPAVVLVEKGSVETCAPWAAPDRPDARPTRAEALAAVMPLLQGLPVVSTTGYTSRELFARGDTDTQFYMQGSMGHAAAFGLGLATRRAGRGPVVVLDGDGAALMHLGAMSTIGAARPTALLHVIFDNNAYESTGAQPTTSPTVDFVALGRALGYASSRSCGSLPELREAVVAARDGGGPHLIVVPIARMTGAAPARATSAVTAQDIHGRFAKAIGAQPPWGRVLAYPGGSGAPDGTPE
jgi:phosphonopyruvate decarboxylase